MDEFSVRDFYALLKMRVEVFVVEQKCPYPELDGKDPDALHLRLLDGDELLAGARILTPAQAGGDVRIGRVVVAPSHRGKRLGEALIREALLYCEQHFPGCIIGLSAQSHLKNFYEASGFTPVSEEYVDDGIPHIDMVLMPEKPVEP